MGWVPKLNGGHATVVRLPRARSEDLVVEELEDEVLIYDKKNKRAHCLGATAAGVWRSCDGTADAYALAESLDVDVDTINHAFDELERAELFERGLEVVPANGSGNGNGGGITRRQLGKRSAQVGGAVMAAPLILSITAPTAAAAATPPKFFCEIFTTGDCGANTGCGSIAGCCCCSKSCPGEASCKGCTSVMACTNGSQPCATVPDTAGTNCSDAKGTNPFTKCGCCGPPFFPDIGSANQGCGCGWGPTSNVNSAGVSVNGFAPGSTSGVGAGCCDITSTGPDPTATTGPRFVMCTTAGNCVPCCGGVPIMPPVNGLNANTVFGCCGGYAATGANAGKDICGHQVPPGYIPTTGPVCS